MPVFNKKLGEILIDSGVITQEQLDYALELQKGKDKKLGEIFIDEGILSEKQIIDVLIYQLEISYIDFNNYIINPDIPRLINASMAKRHLLIPVSKEDDKLIVAMSDPLNIYAIDDVELTTGMIVQPAISTKRGIEDAIERYYGSEHAQRVADDFTEDLAANQLAEMESQIENDISSAPAVRLIDLIIEYAVRVNASDIHIEPFETNLRIRFRIDGELLQVMNSSKAVHSAIVTRIKIMCNLDIAEKRIPQDGSVEMEIGDSNIDLRISILPTIYGEKVVIRILSGKGLLFTKEELGFNEDDLSLFEKIIKSPNGLILVTGPTGSGKTTTLYTILRELNKTNRNIITVEDPVEYRLDGVNQVQVNNKVGVTFANGLRTILRQDPDIILVGEIRDVDTAKAAVRAAITGHLVLSTLHTNDSASTISRLMDMEIEPYLLSASLVGIIAQRLVRKICNSCKIAYSPNESEIKLLGLKEGEMLYKGKGCNSCNYTGYSKRTAIYEILPITKDIRNLIDHRASIDEIKIAASKNGMTSIKNSCIELVKKGITTIDELIRVTFSIE